jgi:hypothetical protein
MLPRKNEFNAPRCDARVIHQDKESLQIAWTLANTSDTRLVVLRHLVRGFDPQGQLDVKPNLAYVSIEEDGTIQISKKLLPVPRTGIWVSTPFVPLGEVLQPGNVMNGELTLDLPLQPWDPYGILIQSVRGFRPLRPVKASCLRFQLGVYTPSLKATAKPVRTALGALLYPHYRQILEAQITLEAPPIAWSGEAYR